MSILIAPGERQERIAAIVKAALVQLASSMATAGVGVPLRQGYFIYDDALEFVAAHIARDLDKMGDAGPIAGTSGARDDDLTALAAIVREMARVDFICDSSVHNGRENPRAVIEKRAREFHASLFARKKPAPRDELLDQALAALKGAMVIVGSCPVPEEAGATVHAAVSIRVGRIRDAIAAINEAWV